MCNIYHINWYRISFINSMFSNSFLLGWDTWLTAREMSLIFPKAEIDEHKNLWMILLMVEILHHSRCMFNPCKWEKLQHTWRITPLGALLKGLTNRCCQPNGMILPSRCMISSIKLPEFLYPCRPENMVGQFRNGRGFGPKQRRRQQVGVCTLGSKRSVVATWKICPIPSMQRTVYLPTWMVAFLCCFSCIGKYIYRSSHEPCSGVFDSTILTPFWGFKHHL